VPHRSVLSTYLVSDLPVTGYDSYSVPEAISEHVDLIRVSINSVHHGHDSPAPLKRSNTIPRNPSLLSRPPASVPEKDVVPSLHNCDQYITPECLRALYSIDYTPQVPRRNSFGIGVSSVKFTCFSSPHPVEFTPQAYLGSDLDMFFSLASFISIVLAVLSQFVF
jgi:tripeptidyl-peptidase-1